MDHEPEPIPAEATAALHVLRRCFADSLLAAYLHGSAVAGGLRPDSDVDVLAVVGAPTTRALRARLLSQLMRIPGLPGTAGQPRPLELVIFRRDDLSSADFPPRSEFVYGEWLRGAFEAGVVPGPGSDPELTVLLAQARQSARPLAGPDAADLLPAVPEDVLRRAMGDTIPALLDSLAGDERNVLLTLARIWCTLSTGKFVPKDAAAAWAKPRLAGEAAELVGLAGDAYLGLRAVDWQDCRQQVRRVADHLRDRVADLL